MFTPHTSSELRDVIRTVADDVTPLRIVGAGTWLDAGRAVAAETRLSVRALAGVVEYVPGDLVITVQAGTSLEEIAEVTAAHGQWLPLDPPGDDRGTIGASMATGSQGALGLGYGRARDLILGVSCVCGDGRVVRAGGRVVKNVAGFDLVRLLTGSWGTLGVLTEMSVRLHARPAVDQTMAISIDGSRDAFDDLSGVAGVTAPVSGHARETALTALVAQLNCRPLLAVTSSLAACVMLSPRAAARAGIAANDIQDQWVLLARMTGNATRVRALQQVLSSVGRCVPMDGAVWQGVRQLDSLGGAINTVKYADTQIAVDNDAASLTFTGAPAQSAQTLRSAHEWCHTHAVSDAVISVEPMRGAVRVTCTLPAHASPQGLPPGTHAERLPARWWPLMPSAVADPLSTQLRHTFNPGGILNPGILGEPAVERV